MHSFVSTDYNNKKPTETFKIQIKTTKLVKRSIKTKTKNNKTQQQLSVMSDNFELLRKFHGAQRGVETKLYNEAEIIMNKLPAICIGNYHISLQ